MKDFYGDQLFTHAQLDHQNTVTIHNNFDDTANKTLYYIPDIDGIFIVGCSYYAGAYVEIVDENAPVNMKLVSCTSVSNVNTTAQSNGMCLAYKGHKYRCSCRRAQWFFIPYKQ